MIAKDLQDLIIYEYDQFSFEEGPSSQEQMYIGISKEAFKGDVQEFSKSFFESVSQEPIEFKIDLQEKINTDLKSVISEILEHCNSLKSKEFTPPRDEEVKVAYTLSSTWDEHTHVLETVNGYFGIFWYTSA